MITRINKKKHETDYLITIMFYNLRFDLRFNLQNSKKRQSFRVKFLKYLDILSNFPLQTLPFLWISIGFDEFFPILVHFFKLTR